MIALFLRQRRAGHRPAPLTHVIIPGIGALIDLWLLINLEPAALLLGVIWLTAGIAVLAHSTRLFRRPPPEMEAPDTSKTTANGDTART